MFQNIGYTFYFERKNTNIAKARFQSKSEEDLKSEIPNTKII